MGSRRSRKGSFCCLPLIKNRLKIQSYSQTRISREEEIYKQEVIRLEKDLADLEGSVEVLRGEVINRRTRVNMAAVEDMALVLSRAR